MPKQDPARREKADKADPLATRGNGAGRWQVFPAAGCARGRLVLRAIILARAAV